MKMTIQTRSSGDIEVEEETILTFPEGLPGFEESRRFKLFHDQKWDAQPQPEPGQRRVYWLQSLDDPEVVFSVVDPAEVGITYQFPLGEHELALLQLAEGEQEQVTVLMMLSKVLDDEGQPGAEMFQMVGARVRPHLNGPLLINTANRRGCQKVLREPRYSLHIAEG